MEHIREWDAKYGPTRPCCIMQGVGLYRFNGYFHTVDEIVCRDSSHLAFATFPEYRYIEVVGVMTEISYLFSLWGIDEKPHPRRSFILFGFFLFGLEGYSTCQMCFGYVGYSWSFGKCRYLVLDLLQKIFYTSDAARESFVELCEEEYVQKVSWPLRGVVFLHAILVACFHIFY